MKYLILFVILCYGWQREVAAQYASFQKNLKMLETSENPESLLNDWAKQGLLPLRAHDSVALVWQGDANNVKWCGDFNGWCSKEEEIPLWQGKLMQNGKVWLLKAKFPTDARLDYKVVIDDNTWTKDKLNPYQQMTGFGDYNSELRMPEWKPDNINLLTKSKKKGKYSDTFQLFSKAMQYKVNVRVYLPFGYEKMKDLPTLYVTDGQEYSHEHNGNLATMLDNLIAKKKIPPMIAVLIDPRNPDNLPVNRRMNELAMNVPFADFVSKELVTYIDSVYRTAPKANKRCILGTSLGGLTAAYLGAYAAQTFGLVAAQSPAFWYKPAIYDLYENNNAFPLKIAMTTGIIRDTEEGARRMKTIMERKKYTLFYKEVNEGHSWGNWRNLIDDMLVFLFENL